MTKLTAAEIAASVRLVIELQLGRATVADKERLVDDLEADSFDVMNIIAVLEEQHDIMITEEQAVDAETVGDVIELISAALES